MNILQIQDDLKNFSEQQLVNEMQRPSGNAPQYLVLSEINRRKRVKEDYQANQPMDTQTVAEEAVASAGVPMSGIAGMAEAMAPKSESSLVAPKTPTMPMREGGEVDYYAGGGLIEGIADSVSANADSLQRLQEVSLQNSKLLQDQQNAVTPQPAAPTPTPVQQPMPMPITPRPITPSFPSFPSRPFPSTPFPFPFRGQVGIGGKGRPRPNVRNMLGTNMFTGLGSIAGQVQPQAMAEGGVINAFSGKYFDSSGRPTNELINAMILQESGGDPKAIGGIGERGLGQIRPTTAIMPGYGVQSLFPELSKQIGKGKKYATAQDAYLDNKEMIDSKLEEGGTSRKFMSDLLTGFRKNTDTDAGAISAFNVGMSGLKNIKNPADFKYFTEVSEKMKPVEYDGTPIDSDFMSAKASGNVNVDKNKIDVGLQEALKKNPQYSEFGDESQTFTTPEKNQNMEGDFGKAGLGRPDLNLFQKASRAMGGKKYAQPGEITFEPPYGQGLRYYGDEDDEKMGDASNIPVNVGTDKEGKFIEETVSTGDPVDDAASLYAEDLEEKEKARIKAEEEEKNKPLTLDEQLAAMQEDLKKSRNQDKWLAIAQAGLSIMASDKPTLGGAIGEGAGAGLQAYRDAQERYNEGVIDVLNARAKLKGKTSTFGMKDILTRISAIDGNISKERENLNKRMMDNPTDKEGIQAIKNKISKLTNLRDSLSVMSGIEPFSVSKDARKKAIAGS